MRARSPTSSERSIWCHWAWFAVPHIAVAYVAVRRPKELGTAAARMYAVFDLGAAVYWRVPTAPPWWAAAHGHLGELDDEIEIGEFGRRYDTSDAPLPVRRMMLEYGEQFWGSRWNDLYDVLGGNPLAAMPSLHFATSLMAARLLSEVDPFAGAIGWAYVSTLGFALVYLGEHYAADLIAGAVLAETVQMSARPVTPAVHVLTGTLRRLRALRRDDARGAPDTPGLVRCRPAGRQRR